MRFTWRIKTNLETFLIKMTSLIQRYVILLASFSCVQLQMFRSSYFKISSQENLDEEEDFTKSIQVYDEFSCALMCSSTVECHFALFDKDSNKCSLVKATENLNQQNEEEPESKAILLEKVGDDERKSESNAFATSLEF